MADRPAVPGIRERHCRQRDTDRNAARLMPVLRAIIGKRDHAALADGHQSLPGGGRREQHGFFGRTHGDGGQTQSAESVFTGGTHAGCHGERHGSQQTPAAGQRVLHHRTPSPAIASGVKVTSG